MPEPILLIKIMKINEWHQILSIFYVRTRSEAFFYNFFVSVVQNCKFYDPDHEKLIKTAPRRRFDNKIVDFHLRQRSTAKKWYRGRFFWGQQRYEKKKHVEITSQPFRTVIINERRSKSIVNPTLESIE